MIGRGKEGREEEGDVMERRKEEDRRGGDDVLAVRFVYIISGNSFLVFF